MEQLSCVLGRRSVRNIRMSPYPKSTKIYCFRQGSARQAPGTPVRGNSL